MTLACTSPYMLIIVQSVAGLRDALSYFENGKKNAATWSSLQQPRLSPLHAPLLSICHL